MKKLTVGTLIEDNGKVGVVTKVIEMGRLDTDNQIIKWRANYEIHYVDGIISVIACVTIDRLVKEGKINIIYRPTTPLPHSPSDLLSDYIDACEQEQEQGQKRNRRTICGDKHLQDKK